MAKKTTRLEELHNTFQENGISPETVMENDVLIREIKKACRMRYRITDIRPMFIICWETSS